MRASPFPTIRAAGLVILLGLVGCDHEGAPRDAGTDVVQHDSAGTDYASDPIEADSGSEDVAADAFAPELPDAGPDTACACRDNSDCVGVLPDLGACEVAVCDPNSCECIRIDAPDGTACDDGESCTIHDTCEDGACVPGAGRCECQADGDCAVLEDGDRCNGTLVCDVQSMPRKCVVDPVTIPACIDEDDDPCRGPVCDPGTGACIPDQPVNEDGDCGDLDACTQDGACVAGTCVGGSAVVCDDGLESTVDSCEPDTGCLFVPGPPPGEDPGR